VFSAVFASSARATVTAKVLDIHGDSLTSYQATSKTAVQDLRPRFDQRGVDIDGTMRVSMPLGWAVGADTLGGGYSSGRTLGDVNLFTGSYNPTDIDLSLPTKGLPVVIGRTYNDVQVDSGASRFDSGGYQGFNWSQIAQPELRLYAAPGHPENDVLYLVYGADRYIEFQRTGASDSTFKAKNGAAGAVQFTAGVSSEPDTYTYYDQRGTTAVFFGSTNAGSAAWQLWKVTSTGGDVLYVGDDTTGSTAITNGFISSSGRVSNMFDGSGHQYVFTYSTYGGLTRLQKVEGQAYISSAWTTVAQVEYDYFTSTDNDKGLAGDLRLVTITMPGLDDGAGNPASYVRRKYYRYYTRSWSNSDGRRGEAHQIKMVVGFDGVRQYDPTGTSFYSETDANLKPYSESYFEYGNGDYRIANVTFNGNCGCGGGTSGTLSFTYDDGSTYGTEVGNTSYDTAWAKRTVIAEPDGTYVSQYFDETGAVLSKVITSSDPSGSPTKKWVYGVDRDSNGLLTDIHSPANATAYTHSTGAITYSSSVGLVTSYTRHSASDNLDGLRESVTVKEGTSGSTTTTNSVSFSERQFVIGTSAISIAQVDSTSTYPDYSTPLTTTYSPTYWSSTNTLVTYLVPQVLTTTNPIVTPGNNGSNSATTKSVYFRTDGTTAFTEDETGVLFYTGRNGWGQTATQIADADIANTGDFTSEDFPGGTNLWSLSSSGSPIHIITTMTYDDQGRLLTSTRPSVNGTITSANFYLLDSYRLGTISFPRKVSTTYYGPGSYTRINHAGKPDQRITFQFSGGTTSPAIPSSSDWSARVDTIYDDAGMRPTETHIYTVDNSTYDTSTVGYDATGRRSRTVDATGTITRTVFDERGMAVERWIGTDDYGWTDPTGVGSSPDMIKVEALEYDSGSGSGGGNGYLTTRAQSSDGAWGAGGYAGGDRCTTYMNDFRGRAVVVGNPVAPHTVSKYDNSNRVTAVAQYSSPSGLTTSTDPTATTASTRVALNETLYDQRGKIYLSKRWQIVQGGGSAGNKGSSQDTNNWYDPNGRLVKTHGARISKTSLDRLGRATDRFDITLPTGSYSGALTPSGDSVLEQVHYALDPLTGLVLAQWLVQRAHDDGTGGSTGALDSNADGDPLKLTSGNIYLHSRAQISSMWYDDWDRVTDIVNYGTNGGSTFNRSGLGCPSSTSTTLKTSYTYDDFGRRSTVTDPAGIVNLTTYDFGGRRSATIDNYVYGDDPGDGTYHDENRETDYSYAHGLVTSVTRRVSSSSSDDEVTTFEYDTTTGVSASSIIKCKTLRTRVIYPEQTGGQSANDRDVIYIYNALSQVSSTIDPAGNVIDTSYDAGGRVTAREASTIALGFDSRVTRIETSYNSRGIVSDVLQKNGGGTTLDEIALDYDDLGNLSSSTQDPDSAIGGGGRASYAMTWSYTLETNSGRRHESYLSSWTQPDGTGPGMTFTPHFLALDISTRRPTWIGDANGASIVFYQRLGSATAATVEYDEPANFPLSTIWTISSQYYDTYVDRFNRPILNQWSYDPGGGGMPLVDLGMDYDLQGNVVAQTDSVMKDAASPPNRVFEYLNTFDGLRRLNVRKEGELAGGHGSISTQSRIENCTRNAAGRIGTDQVSLDSNNTWTDGPLSEPDAGEMNDTRTYNKRNRLTGRSYYSYGHAGTPVSVTLAYDKNGNLTSDGEKYDYVYNPFGQLVAIKLTGTSTYAAKYTYNGLGQRISEQTDTNDSGNTGAADGVVDSYDPVFYIAVDQQGRRVATFRGTDTYPKETFVYHMDGLRGPNFQGGVLLRDRDSDLNANPQHLATQAASSTRSERYYYAADYRGNVIAMVDYTGSLVEQSRYSQSGLPFGIPQGNTDGTGVVSGGLTGADYGIVNYDIVHSAYEARADVNLDGVIDSGDLALVASANGRAAGRGHLSVATTLNTMGFHSSEHLLVGLISSGPQVLLAKEGIVLGEIGGIPGTTPSIDCMLQSTNISQCISCCFGVTTDNPGGTHPNLDACITICQTGFNEDERTRIPPPGEPVRPHCTVDPPNPGIPPTDDECCYKTAIPRCQGDDAGGLICCNGRLIICSWYRTPPDLPHTGGGKRIIDQCIREHEGDHRDVNGCEAEGCRTGICRPTVTPGTYLNREECQAYLIEIDCLKSHLADCQTPDCMTEIARRLQKICGAAQAKCGVKPPGCNGINVGN
jgi:YD repeat-containing protein